MWSGDGFDEFGWQNLVAILDRVWCDEWRIWAGVSQWSTQRNGVQLPGSANYARHMEAHTRLIDATKESR